MSLTQDTSVSPSTLGYIESHIVYIRKHKVMLDNTLAELYGVETKVLIQAIKRNIDRFPEDFMFQLSAEEFENLRSQIVTSSGTHGGRRYFPYVFTEQGVAMLSSVLNSKQAIQVNIEIMRAFVNLRKTIDSYKELKQQIGKLEKKYDKNFKFVFEAIHQLMQPPDTGEKKLIGFSEPKK
jgi:phage regulator Rha-like protein